jgi:hypothetical protein
MSEQKKYYYLFGIDVCQVLDQEGIEGLLKFLKEDECFDYDTRSFEDGENPTELLRTAAGWSDFSVLTEEEYLKITSL